VLASAIEPIVCTAPTRFGVQAQPLWRGCGCIGCPHTTRCPEQRFCCTQHLHACKIWRKQDGEIQHW